MVGSNTSSGPGRFALCESLESRELFSTAALDPAFRGGQVTTHFDGVSRVEADAAVVLKSGRLLVAGVGFNKSSQEVTVLALYNRDGTLSNSFNGSGKLVLNPSVNDQTGLINKVIATPDGGAIISGVVGFAKITANGTLDTSFGFAHNGVDSYNETRSVDDIYVDKTDGSIHVLLDGQKISGKPYTNIAVFDSHGMAGADNVFPTVGTAVFMKDGTGAATTSNDGNYTEYRFAANFTRLFGFGDNGIADMTPAYHSWVNANGPFTKSGTDAKGYPLLVVTNQQLAADGSVVLEGAVLGTSAKLPVTTTLSGSTETRIFITIDPTGKTVTIRSGTSTGGAVVFDAFQRTSATGVNGTFYNTDGAQADVAVGNALTILTASAADTDGAYYVAGVANNGSPTDSVNGFAVARVLPFAGSVTGKLYNDNNRNGKYDTGDTINAGKQVYLDDNNNGKYDAGEISTLTDANGNYRFDGVATGSYHVRRVLPSGYSVTSSTAAVAVAGGKTSIFDIGSATTLVKNLVLV